jgi:hypothetical protein
MASWNPEFVHPLISDTITEFACRDYANPQKPFAWGQDFDAEYLPEQNVQPRR